MSRGAHQVCQPDSVRLQDRLVEGVLDQTQITTVPGIAVQPVVNALGQAKELLGGLNHEPARIDRRAPDERQQRREHLRDSSAPRGGGHVPDRSTFEKLPCAIGGLEKAAELIRVEDHPEAIESFWLDVHFPKAALRVAPEVRRCLHRPNVRRGAAIGQGTRVS